MAEEKKPPPDDEFFDIANFLISDEVNEFLDKRLKLVDKWVALREARGERADLRALVDQFMREPSHKGPIVALLAAALWRIREMESADADQ